MGTLTVGRWRWLPNHEHWDRTSARSFEIDTGKHWMSLSRSFHCECGEPLYDGDRVHEFEDGALLHENCHARIRTLPRGQTGPPPAALARSAVGERRG